TQGSVSAGKEDQTRARIKAGIVDAGADRKTVDHFSAGGIHYHHLRLVAAPDKEAIGFGVIGQSRRHLGDPDGEALFDFQRFRIKYTFFGGVFAVDIDQPVGADYGLFAVALRLYGSDYVAGGGIDCGDVVRAMIIGEHALRAGVIIDAVRASADVDFLDKLKG